MDKQLVKQFFNDRASSWDAETVRTEEIFQEILDLSEIVEGVSVLDVACGTGVLIGDYLKRNVASVLGVDLSDEMIHLAKVKFQQENVSFLCEDIENLDKNLTFDRIMLYNCFPHFEDGERLIQKLSQHLNPNGILTIAHNMGKKTLDKHHSGVAKHISNQMLTEDELATVMAKYLDVRHVSHSDEKIILVGKK